MYLGTVLLVCFVSGSVSTPDRYDQRQHGEMNVRVDMKDVLVYIANGNLIGDYDYNYDYSDLTVKPETYFPTSSSPTTSSTTTTEEPSLNKTEESSTVNSAIPSSNLSTSAAPVNKTQTFSDKEQQIPVIIIHDRENDRNIQNVSSPDRFITKQYVSSASIRRKHDHNLTDQPSRNCAPGFFLDNQNRCKKIRRHALLQRDRTKLPFGLHFPQLRAPHPHSHPAPVGN